MISIVDPAWAEENAKSELAFKKREIKREISSLAIKIKAVDERLAQGSKKLVKSQRENNQKRGNQRQAQPRARKLKVATRSKKDADMGTMYRRKRSLALDSKERMIYQNEAIEERRAQNRQKMQKMLVSNSLKSGGIKTLFQMIDTDHSGEISLKEWRAGLNRLTYSNKGMRKEAVGLKMVADEIFHKIDVDGNNSLDLDELTAYLQDSVKDVPPPKRVETWAKETKVSPRAANTTLKSQGWEKGRARNIEAKLLENGTLDWWACGDAVLKDHGGVRTFCSSKKPSDATARRSRGYMELFNAKAAAMKMSPDFFGIVTSARSTRPASARTQSGRISDSSQSARPSSAVPMKTVAIDSVIQRYHQEKTKVSARTRAANARFEAMNLSDNADLFQPFLFHGRWNGFNQEVNG
jgi:Ca2+-binding EF-hand superfamily protein